MGNLEGLPGEAGGYEEEVMRFLTKQQIYDRVKAHLLKQGRKAHAWLRPETIQKLTLLPADVEVVNQLTTT